MKYHYGEVALHSFNGKLENLKSQINAKTGIPNNIQKLYYKNCLLNEESITAIPNGSTVMLLLPSCGGTGNCDICYEDGEFICSDCHDKIYCAVQWRIQEGIPGSHGSPLSAQLSSKSVCTTRNFSLDGSPLPHEQQNYSDCSSLTSVYERILVDCLP